MTGSFDGKEPHDEVVQTLIALDTMGGDHAPDSVIDGAARALRDVPNLTFSLFGNQDLLAPLLRRHKPLAERSRVIHTDDFIANDARPSTALRQGRQSSMRLAVNAVKERAAFAAVSAGNTGALMAIAKVVLRTLDGIDRPAIASALPGENGPVIMLDLGANAECGADNLFQFAVMGDVYARCMFGIDSPRVGLLNIGTEEQKGNDVVRDASMLLRERAQDINYVGFIEGTDVSKGGVDVVVTDGFTGNVALKIAEGTAKLFANELRSSFLMNWRGKLAYLMARSNLQRLKDKFDPRLYNGAMFLGINGVVVKSHGNTDGIGFANAIKCAADLVRLGANDMITTGVQLYTKNDGEIGLVTK